MVIYVDVLIATNIIINYFLLLISARLDRREFSSLRIILASLLGGIFSLYILLELNSTVIDIFVKAVCCLAMVLTAFGYKSLKNFLRSSFFLLLSSMIFAGSMYLVCSFYKNSVIVVNNSTVYFNVSVVMLIICAVAVYFIVSVILYFTHKKALKDKICKISVWFGGYNAELTGFFDTGNSLTDNFSDNAVILVDKNFFVSQNTATEEFYKKRYRILPCKTVNGSGILEGFRADKMVLFLENENREFINPLVMFSKTKLKDGFNAVLNTDILER